MPAAYVDTPQAWVRLRGDHLEVVLPSPDTASGLSPPRNILLLGLDRLFLREHSQITTEALCALFAAGVTVCWVDYKGDCLGLAHQPSHPEAATRCRQYERCREPDVALAIARELVVAKIYNQRRLLQRLEAARPRLEGRTLEPLVHAEALARGASTVDEVRGAEGNAAARYFELWSCFLPAEFPWERRSTRPPHNAVNAALSYAATLLYHDLVAPLHQRGLDPGVGFLHATENGRWSLALDLMEPFRPAVAEALVFRLFSHRILRMEHFESRDGGVFLTRDGRRHLIEHYERRLDRPFLSEQLGRRTTLRQAYLDQVLALKAALEDPAVFTAFRLN